MANKEVNFSPFDFFKDGTPVTSIFKNKARLREFYYKDMTRRLISCFRYENLPETMPVSALERQLMNFGYAVIVKDTEINTGRSGLFATNSAMGTRLNAYGLPTEFILANPFLKDGDRHLINGKDSILIRSDSCLMGLRDLNDLYASALADAMTSIRYGLINTRLMYSYQCESDSVRDGVKAMLKKVEDGDGYATFNTNQMIPSIKEVFNSPANDFMKTLLEVHQYIRATWNNELGIQDNPNMKREALNAAETEVNERALLPLIDDMLECRKQGVKAVNELFGTNITVDLASAWKEDDESETEEIQSDNGNNETD